ncbi:MAG: response regulator, partial [Candidatus Eisenbacteria bacterium]|nr:response regulator [Candidatus Eisenbacteria bacterium]
VIAMTAHAMKGDRERCLRTGMDDYICKPLQPGDLADVIERWMCSGGAVPSPQWFEEDEIDGSTDGQRELPPAGGSQDDDAEPQARAGNA